jgi:phosphatidylinositol kinase/protein kinase (PI-3  family)
LKTLKRARKLKKLEQKSFKQKTKRAKGEEAKTIRYLRSHTRRHRLKKNSLRMKKIKAAIIVAQTSMIHPHQLVTKAVTLRI